MKKTIEIPECYDELSTKQFCYLLKSFWRMMYDSNITAYDVKCDFANYMLGRKVYVNPFRNEQYNLLVHDIATTMHWLFDDTDNKAILAFDTTENLLPSIGKYTGPQSHGADMRFGEFRTAIDIMNAYTENDDAFALDALVGLLYRKPNKQSSKQPFDGNYRTPYNKYEIERYGRNAAKIPEHLKYGVYLWFANFCKYLMSGEFNIDGRWVCFAPIFGSKNNNTDERTPEADKLGMLSILFTLAETGTFGNVEQTDNAPLLDVMCKLLNDYNQAKQLQR